MTAPIPPVRNRPRARHGSCRPIFIGPLSIHSFPAGDVTRSRVYRMLFLLQFGSKREVAAGGLGQWHCRYAGRSPRSGTDETPDGGVCPSGSDAECVRHGERDIPGGVVPGLPTDHRRRPAHITPAVPGTFSTTTILLNHGGIPPKRPLPRDDSHSRLVRVDYRTQEQQDAHYSSTHPSGCPTKKDR